MSQSLAAGQIRQRLKGKQSYDSYITFKQTFRRGGNHSSVNCNDEQSMNEGHEIDEETRSSAGCSVQDTTRTLKLSS